MPLTGTVLDYFERDGAGVGHIKCDDGNRYLFANKYSIAGVVGIKDGSILKPGDRVSFELLPAQSPGMAVRAKEIMKIGEGAPLTPPGTSAAGLTYPSNMQGSERDKVIAAIVYRESVIRSGDAAKIRELARTTNPESYNEMQKLSDEELLKQMSAAMAGDPPTREALSAPNATFNLAGDRANIILVTKGDDGNERTETYFAMRVNGVWR